jgi:hypothetical protein
LVLGRKDERLGVVIGRINRDEKKNLQEVFFVKENWYFDEPAELL